MTKKITTIFISIMFIISIVPICSYANELDSAPVSVGVVEKDLDTGIVRELVYSENSDGSTNVNEINSWTDTSSEEDAVTTFSTANSLLNLRSVIGSDGRTVVSNTRQFPYSAICYLEIHFGTTTMRGTGFFIDDNVVATAGHCIYDDELGFATSITVKPGRDGLLSIPYGLAVSKTLAVSTQWHESCDKNYDWGAFSIRSGIIGNPGIFSLTTISDNTTISNAKISGYPATINGSTTYKQYEMSGSVSTFTAYKLSYTIDTSGGQSGAPILNSNNVVIGIHTSGSSTTNYGVRVTSNMLYYYNEFISNYG